MLLVLCCTLGSPPPAAADPAVTGGGAVGGEPRFARQSDITRAGMLTLGGWAVAHLVGGTAGALLAADAATAGFWEMNALWNTVNLTLAGVSLATLEESPTVVIDGRTVIDLPAYRRNAHSLEKVLLFNAGVDLGYMALGGWFWERGARGYGLDGAGVSAERLAGWGQALVVQGGFLFLFDLILARAIARDRRSVTDRQR